ncbi:MAG: hypothetical protein R3B48_08195 [Kofleriaceae bacterium]
MKTSPAERERLIAAATSAYRARDAEGRIQPSPSWLDLDAEGRREAFASTVELRALEAATDPSGLTSTARAVLARLVGGTRDA